MANIGRKRKQNYLAFSARVALAAVRGEGAVDEFTGQPFTVVLGAHAARTGMGAEDAAPAFFIA